jgi:tetratricopeptide (TPR) repeat protein
VRIALVCAALVVCSIPASARFGRAQDASALDQAERLADRGEIREARQALARWESDFGASAPLDQQARAWFLAGRLAEDGDEAELHYLRVIIEGSTTAYADDALLRLAQYKHAQGEFAKVVEYLGRLRRDYPTSERGPEALLWISRAAREMGDTQRACAAAEQGLVELAPDDTLLERSFREEQSACGTAERTYTVQVAAFREEAAAQNLARDLLIAGYDAWVLGAKPDDPIYRVRVGRGLLEAEAQALIDRLVEDGHSPFLVSQPEPIGGRRP